MGLGPAAVKLNLDLWRQGYFKNVRSVIDMGSQELHLKLPDFEKLVQMAGVPDYQRKDFSDLERFPGFPRCSAKLLYHLLGIKNYSCIDLNKQHGSIALDLNHPLEDKSLYGAFDLVTDHGTNEHAFNIMEAYRTMHRLCRVNGILMSAQAVYKGNGYYMFDASFFEGMSAANDYKILFTSYVVTTPADQYHLPLSRELLDLLDWTKIHSIGICYCMQKQSGKDFCLPYQGGLLSEYQRNQGYQLQYLQNPPSRSYVPIHGVLQDVRTKEIFQESLGRIAKKVRKTLKIKK